MLFLRDWGSSLVAGLVIPATIAVTLIVLRLLGESLDLMTLGGLAAAVGLVIDDAIVVVENIVLHRDSGQSRGDAIRSALREIRVPLVGSTITPIVVFLPLITITGVTGTSSAPSLSQWARHCLPPSRWRLREPPHSATTYCAARRDPTKPLRNS